MPAAIKIEHLSKQYRLGTYGARTLREDLQRMWAKIRGKDDPLQKIGEVNKLDQYGNGYIWALKDINLTVEQGEVLGIIGKNGAGKSTLLKILSRITSPTEGVVSIRGRIGSLLEVGTGFHPELTGRENIFLNGAILGMSRDEIRRKFDDIVDFAGIARYIDTPVKRYSSGMYVRLGFAVAAFLDPDILVVDEVLAVGDAEFQKRAIGKMKEVSSSQGRTVLFVSHNMASIKALCERAILLDKGKIIFDGNVYKTVEKYISKTNFIPVLHKSWRDINKAPGNEFVKLLSFSVKGEIIYNNEIEFEIKYRLFKKAKIIDVTLHFFNEEEILIFNISTAFKKDPLENQHTPGDYLTKFKFKNLLKPGNYTVTIRIVENRANRALLRLDNIIKFTSHPAKENIYLDIEGFFRPEFTSIKQKLYDYN